MFKCEVCRVASQPGEKKNLWPVPRQRVIRTGVKPVPTAHQEIAYEVPVCHGCYSLLVSGMDLKVLMKCHGRPTQVPPGPPQKILYGPTNQPVQGGMDVDEDNSPVPDPNVKELVIRCDLCGAPATNGQVTANTVLCKEHAKKARDSTKTGRNNKKGG